MKNTATWRNDHAKWIKSFIWWRWCIWCAPMRRLMIGECFFLGPRMNDKQNRAVNGFFSYAQQNTGRKSVQTSVRRIMGDTFQAKSISKLLLTKCCFLYFLVWFYLDSLYFDYSKNIFHLFLGFFVDFFSDFFYQLNLIWWFQLPVDHEIQQSVSADWDSVGWNAARRWISAD